MNIKTPLLTTIVLALVAATPAAAHVDPDLPRSGDPAYAVPAGKIEHSITVTKVTGSQAVARHTRNELWMTRKRARSVTTDVETGRVTFEMVITPTETRTYSAQARQVTARRTRRADIPWNSFLFEMALQRAYVEQGITKVIGETTVRDRRALIVESMPGKWTSDRRDGRTVAVIDAETYALYERTSTLPNGTFTQKETLETQELLSPSARVRFAMSKHAGATIRHTPANPITTPTINPRARSTREVLRCALHRGLRHVRLLRVQALSWSTFHQRRRSEPARRWLSGPLPLTSVTWIVARSPYVENLY